MSFFSKSSSSNGYKHGHYGSKHYKSKGVLGNIFNILNSSRRSKGHYTEPYHDNSYQMNSSNAGNLCPNCNSSVSDGAKFCPNCGRKLEARMFCASCGTALSTKDKFCPSCGKKV